MDENALSNYKIEISSKSNNSKKYYLSMKKTLQFLVPISLVSFLVSYTWGFSFILSYNFHFSTLVFPFFAQALERKYMFLIFNGILAFLVKTLNFNSSSSSLSLSNFNDNEDSEKPFSESTPENVAVLAEGDDDDDDDQEGEVYYAAADYQKNELAEEDNQELLEGIEENEEEVINVPLNGEITEYVEMLDDEEEEEDGGLIGASAAEDGINEVNVNTEELNKKFEEFIRKMKEELRIQALQPQLVTV
ncbi:hypothetical protein ACH5RR_014661 [Cinchona calisaya]|uniref:Uncharacterized protein n=1 Tax=Cinchona calisaya TaxID=153742 RepID=A0ABD2ZTM8_9GENT